MFNTKDLTVGNGKTKPVITAGNQVIKINSISLDQTPYDKDSYHVTLHVESMPVEGDFEGFLVDVNKPNGPRYLGQVGRVKMSAFAYKSVTLENGREIDKDTEIMKAMVFLSEVLGKRTELDNISANTIESFITSCNSVLGNSKFINSCIGGREWVNNEGYTNLDLFLPRISKDGIPLEALEVEKSRLITFNKTEHVKPATKKVSENVTNFEPGNVTKTGDFEL